MTRPIRVLHLEDSPRDAEMLHDQLKAGDVSADIVLVNSKERFEAALAGDAFDLVLCDYNLPGYDGIAAVKSVCEQRPETPVIVVSGTMGEEEAVKCLHIGATDYLLKQRLDRLVPAVRRAIQEAEERRRRKDLEETLRQHVQLLSSIYGTVADSLFSVDVEQDGRYRFTSVNRAFTSTTGLEYSQVVGKRVDEVIPEPSLTLVLEKCGEAIRERRIVRWEEESEYPTGRLTGDVSIAPVFDDAGNCTRLVGSVHDLAERKQSEQLEATSANKSRFLASMSHELRTPLNSILGFAELLQDQDFGPLDERQLRFVTNIRTSGTHLLGLINDILDLSKVAAGKIELHLEGVHVHEVLQGIGDLLRPLADRKHQTFTIHPADVDLHVLADAARFKQVLYNLISNAIKFTPEGGHIDVRAVALPDAVQVSVQDDGIGIAEDDQERIFEEFQQVDSALSRQFEGTGLGLALTRNFVRLQGGDLSVASAPGKGSTFTFTLPRDADTVAARSDVSTVDVAAQARQTILIIEDDPRSRELVTTHLTREGYHVLHATDGEDGVRKAREWQPFAIVLDILLPLKNGWDVLTELKTSPATTSIPVVILSVVDDQLRGFDLGTAGYLTKPVNRSELIAAVKNLSLTTKTRNRRVQVLIVDDDPQARELVVAAFKPYGFQLLTATSGREALRIITEAHPDLVILDLMMPDVNGFDVVDAMKADPATAEIPVFILSAKDLSPEERERLNGQVTTRLDKRGFSPQQLLTELRKLETRFPLKTPIVDGLTALFNEAYFEKRLHEEVARGRRYGRHFSVALVDIDHFGDFNVAHGRQQGDLALQQFSRLLENTLRGADPVARLGGDVFAVLLPETIGASAVTAAEKLRATVQNEVFRVADGEAPARLTVSIGLACYPVDGETPDEIAHSARKALETAQALNHNKVMAASPRTVEGGPTA